MIHVTSQGSTFNEGSIRPGDRILALNGKALHDTTLPQLQSLLYAQDGDTVFTVEYDIMSEGPSRPSGPLLVEIKRDVGDMLGFGLNKCLDSGHIFIESVKAARYGFTFNEILVIIFITVGLFCYEKFEETKHYFKSPQEIT